MRRLRVDPYLLLLTVVVLGYVCKEIPMQLNQESRIEEFCLNTLLAMEEATHHHHKR